jgi:NADH:ubiquinone oxidoreductase subunit
MVEILQNRDSRDRDKEKEGEKWISLREASKISGYSPDYIGYLIRTGKIPGRMVYTGVSWQTTREAILAYKNRQQRKKGKMTLKEKMEEELNSLKSRLKFEFNLLKMFFKEFKVLLLFLFLLIFFITSISALFFSSKLEKKIEVKEIEKKERITF